MFNYSKITERIFLVVAIAFLAFVLFLFAHICFGYDEYLWKSLYIRHGFTSFFTHIYNSLSFRYSTHFYLYLIFNYVDSDWYRFVVFLSQLIVVSITVFSFYSITGTLFNKWFDVSLSVLKRLISSLLFSAALYFFTSQIVEIYTYTSSFFSYYMPIAFLCLGVSILIKEKTTWFSWFILLLSAFSLGGSAENVSASAIGVMSVFFGSVVLQQKFALKKMLSDKRIQKLFVFIALTSLFALVAYTAPGAKNRAATEANNLLLKANPLFAPVSLDVFLWKFSHPTNIFAVMMLSWFAYLGLSVPRDMKGKTKRITLWCLVFFIIGFSIHLLITKVIFGSYGYLRIWFPVNFYLCLFLASMALFLGTFISPKTIKIAAPVLGFISLIFIGSYFYRHYSKVAAFSHKYFERREWVKNECLRSSTDTITTANLPDPDILYHDKYLRFPQDSLSTFFCIFNEIPCTNVIVK